MVLDFSGLRHRNCRFIVAGRLAQGVFKGLADIDVPQELQDLFEGLPEDNFRMDISSTQLRQSQTSV